MNNLEPLNKNIDLLKIHKKNYFAPLNPKRAKRKVKDIKLKKKFDICNLKPKDTSLELLSKMCENTNHVSLPKLPLIKKLGRSKEKEYINMIDLSSCTIHMQPRSSKTITKESIKISPKKSRLTVKEKSNQNALDPYTHWSPIKTSSKILIRREAISKSPENLKNYEKPSPMQSQKKIKSKLLFTDRLKTKKKLRSISEKTIDLKNKLKIEDLDISGW